MLGKAPAIRVQLVHLIRHEFLSGPTRDMDFVDVEKSLHDDKTHILNTYSIFRNSSTPKLH